MKFTFSVRSRHTPLTPSTRAWPPSWPSVPTSRATRVTSDENARSWSTIVLMVSFSSSTSPRTSTVILRERSPFATAVVTSAMFRTCAVSEVAIVFTFSVRSRDARDLGRERAELVDHRVDGLLQLEHLALDVHGDLAGEVAVRDGGRDVGD